MITRPLLPIANEAPAQTMPQARSGDGTLLTVSWLGNSVSVPRRGRTFDHPFRPALGGRSLRFTLGLILSTAVIVPRIGKVPMNGGKNGAAPTLALDAAQVSDEGVSYAVLEVEPDASGKLTKDSRVEIVASGDGSESLDPKLGRKAIAMILWRAGVPLRAIPIVRFNMVYQRVIPAPGGGPVRHFFL